MAEKDYIKVGAIYKKLKAAEENHQPIYISGAVGFGKTAAVSYYFRRKPHLYLSGEKGYLENRPEEAAIKQSAVVIDDISWIMDRESQEYIVELAKSSEKFVVIIGRGRIPSWLRLVSVEQNFVLADERELALTEKETVKFLERQKIQISDAEVKSITTDTFGHPLSILFVTDHMKGGFPYSQEVLEAARRDLFHYYDHAFYEKWDSELCELLLSVCQYPTFTVEMAGILTGNDRIEHLLEYTMSLGTFMIYHGDGVYSYRQALQKYMKWKQALVCSKDQILENYEKAASYFESKGEIEQALKYYEKAGNKKKVSRLLIENAEQHPGTGHFFETKDYYLRLPKETILASPVLMSGMSMLYSITLQPEESEDWYDALVRFEKSLPQGNPYKREAKIRIAYLDIALPHRGIHGVMGILKNLSILVMNKNIRLPEFSVTSNLPSIMNGGLDFCEWSRNDKELSVLMKKPIEVVLGKYGAGLINIALAESGFEKGTMDTYEAVTRLNTGYMKADTAGKIEMCFAAIGLLAKVHVYEGQIGVAKESVQNFKEKAINEQASQLVPNIEALETKIALLQGKNDIAREWFEKAPNENISFCVLYRYQYMQKIRCLMAFRRYEEAIHLIERLNLYFTQYDRTYLWMENQTLKAIVQYQTGNKEWKTTLNNVLRKMESYHFIRIAGMEGIALKPLLDDYQEPPVSEEFFALLKKEVGRMAKHYPNYLREEKKLKEPISDEIMSKYVKKTEEEE
ncbi:MAG: hypothetical protein EOM00_11770, partial [Clostridia bacterium]|nr:hypothetical protein [Clostridia bacterium]